MSQEYLTARTHDSGLFGWDFKYWTDVSVDLGYEKFRADASDGIDHKELVDFIKSAADRGQLTEREARQVSNAMRVHRGQMDDVAAATADWFDGQLVARLPDVHNCSHQKLAGKDYDGTFFAAPRNGFPDRDIFEGQGLDATIWFAEFGPALQAIQNRR